MLSLEIRICFKPKRKKEKKSECDVLMQVMLIIYVIYLVSFLDNHVYGTAFDSYDCMIHNADPLFHGSVAKASFCLSFDLLFVLSWCSGFYGCYEES